MPDLFEVSELRITPRFNIAPSQMSPVVRLNRDGRREIVLLRWGLIPHWMKERPSGSPMINARTEGLDQKPAFRGAFKYRRCLVPADGFYEWKQVAGRSRRQPFFFQLRDRALFAFAGLWEHFERNAETIESFTILTCEANRLVREVHPRMPVILPRDGYRSWLESGTEPPVRHRLLAPFDPAAMQSHPVSLRVNSPNNDDAGCIEPWSEDGASVSASE